jgi:D-glycero-D-manno-heptose 1,7-bisphosphate phosphatase
VAEKKMDANRRPAVFLDRDGTIAEEMGYLNHISRFRMFPFAAEAIRRLNELRISVIVVTNQSGAARGFFPETLIHTVHARMRTELAAENAHLDGIYYCTHVKADECDCRKPLPGMLERAASELPIELRGSFIVGDRYDDVRLAHEIDGRSILVMTGYGRGEFEWNRESWPRQPDFVVENLMEAVDVIAREWK